MSNISQNFLSDVKMTDFNLDSTRPSWEVLEMPGNPGAPILPFSGTKHGRGWKWGSGGIWKGKSLDWPFSWGPCADLGTVGFNLEVFVKQLETHGKSGEKPGAGRGMEAERCPWGDLCLTGCS